MAKRNILVDIDLNQNEIQNAVLQNLATAPNNPVAGQTYFNTADGLQYVYDGTNWIAGKTYTEGNGIDITNGVISIDNTVTGATKCKVTFNNQGLITGGDDLSASDIPNLSLSKITDVTATATEVNVLDGITASTAELNIMDGVTVTATDINSVTSKISLTDLSIDSGSTNYLGYDNATGKFSAKVDTTVTANSTKLVTSGAVQTAISNAMVGGMVYKGVWTATGQTDYSSIALPVKAGYMYLVSGSATIGGIEWNTDDYLVINADVAAGGTITDVKKIDNTEGSDIVRLNATQTLTNKTIDADDNTISDLTTSNLKSGVLQTTVRGTASASDTAIPTEKAVATAISGMTKKMTTNNTALTASSGVCTWTTSNTLATADVNVQIFEVATGTQVMAEVTANTSTITIKFNSSSNIAANTYKMVAIG